MPQTSEDIISGILNWARHECGGRMGGPTKEFKCQGQCRKDWPRSLGKSLNERGLTSNRFLLT